MKLIRYILIIFIISFTSSFSNDQIDFQKWKKNFKKIALKNNISETTFDIVMTKVKFLPDVIKYDRYQPEFYEDTFTYIKKRTNFRKVKKGLALYKKEKLIIDKIDKKFLVEIGLL